MDNLIEFNYLNPTKSDRFIYSDLVGSESHPFFEFKEALIASELQCMTWPQIEDWLTRGGAISYPEIDEIINSRWKIYYKRYITKYKGKDSKKRYYRNLRKMFRCLFDAQMNDNFSRTIAFWIWHLYLRNKVKEYKYFRSVDDVDCLT